MHIIRNIIIIAVIILIVFLGQKPYFQKQGTIWLQKADSYISPYKQKIDDFIKNQVLGRVGGEVDKKKQEITQELSAQKEKVSQDLWQQIKNYFAEKYSNLVGTKVEP
jgi:hypothetical protein